MKIIIVLIIVLTFSNVYSQTTVLIDETFESGNIFTLENGTQTNKWVRNTAVSKDGSYSLYVTNNTAGSPPPAEYSNSSPDTYVYAFYYVSFPHVNTSYYLTFWVKGLGNNSDALRVYDVLGNIAPTAGNDGSFFSGSLVGSSHKNYGEWIKYGIRLPVTDAGQNRTIIFKWQNDNTTISNPSISIDNIKLTASVPSPLNGTYTIDNSIPTGGTNFNDFVDAVLRLNSDGISGPVTFNVTSGQTFNNVVPIITATGTSSNAIIFQKSGLNANPVIKGSSNSASPIGILNIAYCDYLTFDGIDLTEISDGTYLTTNYGINIFGSGSTNGAQNNTFKNFKITHNRGNTSSRAIYQNSTATNANGANSYNKFQNITIENVYQGIYVVGNATYPDLGIEISNCTIGANTANDIGNGASTVNGIRMTSVGGANVFNNEVRNVSSGNAVVYGIYLENIQGINNLYKNNVHDIQTTNTAANLVYGIRADINSTHTCNVYNNFVFALTHGITVASATQLIRGISVALSGTGTGNIYYNSVRIDEDAAPSSTAMYIGTNAGTFNIQNNIFSNFSTAGATSLRYCIFKATGSTLGSVINNDYYINTSGTNNNVGSYNGTNYNTVALWQTATGKDANSISVNPQFFSQTDLHSSSSFLFGAGTQIATISTDIDGDTRLNPPCIGADEFPPVKVLGTIVYNQASTSTVNAGTSNNEILRIDLPISNNYGSLKLNSIEFSSLNTNDADVNSSGVKLYITSDPVFSPSVQLGSSVSFSGGKAAFTNLDYELTGNATTYLWLSYDIVEEPTHGNTLDAKIEASSININGETFPSTEKNPTGSRIIVSPMSGTYTINNAGFGPRNYTSFTDAVNDLNSRPLSGPVVFDVSIGQIFTGPINITQTGTSSNTITFRKSSLGTKPTVEYSGSTGTESIVTLNGSDYITFDGINFRPTSGSSAVEYGFYFSGSTDNGCNNNTIINCDVSLDKTNINSRCVFLNSTATSSNGRNSENKFYNNNLSNSYNAYYFNGNTFFYDLNNEIDAIEGETSYIALIGGGSEDVNVIYYANQSNIKIRHTVIQSNSTNTGYVRGIYSPIGDNSSAIVEFNTICSIRTVGIFKFCDGIQISSSGSIQIGNNIIYNITAESSSGVSGVRGIYCGSTNASIYSNDIYSLSNTAINPSYSVKGIQSSGNIYLNSIHDLSSTIESVYAIESFGTTGNIYKNRIYNLNYSGSSNSFVSGIYSTGGNKNVFNNIIYNISSPNSSNELSTRGLGFGAGTISLYYNTVYLSYVSQNSSNGSYALYVGNSVTSIDIRNNILINNVDVTTGTRAACITKGNTNYSNISLNTNYNLYYTGSTTDPKKLIFYDGTNSEQTLTGYLTRIGSGREAYSVSGDPGFTSNTNLIPNPSNPNSWILSGNGIHIASVTTDITGANRPADVSAGAPDIGAYEFTASELSSTPNTFSITPVTGVNSVFVNGRKLISLNFTALGGITSIGVQFYSGVPPPRRDNYPTAQFMNGYFVVTPTGGSSYTYDITYYYSEPQRGTITNENYIRLSKNDGNLIWTAYTDLGTAPGQYQINTTLNTIDVFGLNSFSTFSNSDKDAPFPVQLSSFTSSMNGRDVILNWKTDKEINNSGFNVERIQSSEFGIQNWEKIGYVKGKGNVNTTTSYSFEDKKLNSGKYKYRLKQIDVNGNFEYFNLNGEVEVGLPTKFNISQNYPNPFNPATKIDFDLPFDSKVNIVIYDISGRKVQTLVNDSRTAGYHTVQFNVQQGGSSTLSSGIYFYRIITKSAGSDYVMTKKMALIK